MNKQQFHAWFSHFLASDPVDDSPLIMGVLNVTPNSFSDGGQYLDVQKAMERARAMVDQGADLIDVGGEASNPYGSYELISVDEELSRVIPVIESIRDISDVMISIDTCKSSVMREAVSAGATMINDIMALRGEDSLQTAQSLGVPICLMHMRGTPDVMQESPCYPLGVMNEIHSFFSERVAACLEAGIPKHHLILDPGIGFGKSLSHNLTILNQLSEFKQHHLPLLLGVSRKGLIGEVLGQPISGRMVGGITIALYAMMQGIGIIRTHDVDETRQAFRMMEAILS